MAQTESQYCRYVARYAWRNLNSYLKSTSAPLLKLLKQYFGYTSVRNWLSRFEEYGLEGMEDLPRSASPALIPRKKLPKIEIVQKNFQEA